MGNQYNGLQVDGTITGTVTWDGDNAFPFLVNGDLTVNEGAQLTLTPGTVMKFRNSTDELWVNGTLIADASGTGTRPSSSPRTSTTLWAATPTTTAAPPPLRPTIGVRSASRQAAAAACWTTSSCATAATGTTKTSTSPPAVTLRNSTISHSGEYGIQFENTLPASLTNLRFENNGLRGLCRPGKQRRFGCAVGEQRRGQPVQRPASGRHDHGNGHMGRGRRLPLPRQR
ncbi:MAG: hypothetical protein R2873_18745 [Caldilineaceae bacterium]